MGPYSQLAGEWNGHKEPPGHSIAEWIMKDFKIPLNEYREMAHKMNPVKFDAHEMGTVSQGNRDEVYAFCALYYEWVP